MQEIGCSAVAIRYIGSAEPSTLKLNLILDWIFNLNLYLVNNIIFLLFDHYKINF